MAASFPNAKKTFSAVVNGVTKLVAALFNSPYDEIEAVETFVGPTGGGAQAYSESLTNLLYNYKEGCCVDYKGAADLYVRSGEIMVTDASGNRRLRRNTSDTTVTWANIDTGSEATSTVYYVYAVADASATTFTVMVSTNATTPTGATFFKLIGTFYNNSAGNIERVGNLPRKELGNWVDHSANYGAQQAQTDGFVCVRCIINSIGGNATELKIEGYTDANADPTTIRAMSFLTYSAQIYYDSRQGGFMMPVKKGDYWKVVYTLIFQDGGTQTLSVYWISLS